MKYHHGISQHRRRKYLKRIFIFSMVVIVLVILAIIIIRLDGFLQDKVNTPETTTSNQTSSYFASSDKIFTTDYFQFQAAKNWVEIPSESTTSKFVYRGVNKPIIEDELIIYVNEIPADLSATRLLPAETSASARELIPGTVSDHCNGASADHNIDEKVVTFKKVKMNCDIDNTQFNVLVGLVEGSTRMKLKRPDGSSADYTILYRNVKAIPDGTHLLEIIRAFQTR